MWKNTKGDLRKRLGSGIILMTEHGHGSDGCTLYKDNFFSFNVFQIHDHHFPFLERLVLFPERVTKRERERNFDQR